MPQVTYFIILSNFYFQFQISKCIINETMDACSDAWDEREKNVQSSPSSMSSWGAYACGTWIKKWFPEGTLTKSIGVLKAWGLMPPSQCVNFHAEGCMAPGSGVNHGVPRELCHLLENLDLTPICGALQEWTIYWSS